MCIKEHANELGALKDHRSSYSKDILKKNASNFKIPLHFLGVPSQSASKCSLAIAEIHPNFSGKFCQGWPK